MGWIQRSRRLITADDLQGTFAPKKDLDALEKRLDEFVTVLEFDAHARREDERYQRLIDDVIAPLKEQSHTLQTHALAIASMQVHLEHFGATMDHLARSIEQLTSQIIQTRTRD